MPTITTPPFQFCYLTCHEHVITIFSTCGNNIILAIRWVYLGESAKRYDIASRLHSIVLSINGFSHVIAQRVDVERIYVLTDILLLKINQ